MRARSFLFALLFGVVWAGCATGSPKLGPPTPGFEAARCTVDAQCPGGGCQQGTCSPFSATTDSCTFDSECLGGSCRFGTCSPVPPGCNFDSDCPGGSCRAGSCSAFGPSCSLDSQCGGGSCQAGSCSPVPP